MDRSLLGTLVCAPLIVACGNLGNDSGPERGTLGPAPVAVLSADERGAPRMIAPLEIAPDPAGSPVAAMDAARAHVERLASTWGIAERALPLLDPIAEVPATRGTIARFRQVIDGLPVDREEVRALVAPTGELVLASGTLIGTDAPRTANAFAEPDTAAIARAVRHNYGAAFDGGVLAERRTGPNGTRFVAGGSAAIDVELARAEKVWHRSGDQLVAAWRVEAYTSRGSANGDAFRTIIAAADGAVLAHESLLAHAPFQYRVFAETTGELHPFDGPHADAIPHPTGTMNGSYPNFVTPNLVTVDGLNHPGGGATPDPWLAAGATETTGNNVDAYADLALPTGFTAGDLRPSVTSAGVFNRAYDTALGPLTSTTQTMAAVTHLFFMINWLHDFWYDAGFTEAAGNAQASNYGRGGVEGDRILAEGQDDALTPTTRNNANMATPLDGMSPRMQVYLWDGKVDKRLTVQTNNRTPPVGATAYPPETFDRTGALILGVDAVAPANDACTALTNTVTNRVVLVDRGECTIERKTLNVQLAGGIGVIVVNNVAGISPPNFANDPAINDTLTIGTLSVTMSEGAALKAELLAGTVNVALHRGPPPPDLDGDLDSSVIAHEFGHYLHHRLNNCSNNMCRAVSEGWGDFLALMLGARAADAPYNGAYPIGIYSTVDFTIDPGYFGIRRAPYSASTTINALSYRHMADNATLPTTHPILAFPPNSEVHNAGEIWAAVMWEVYTSLLKQPSAVFATVRSTMAKYIVSGLLMMPSDPSPMESRDALLKVASAADRPVMLQAFARRGMGSCANPPANGTSFNGILESTEIKGRVDPGAVLVDDSIATCDMDNILDNGETAKLTFPYTNRGHVDLTNITLTPRTTTPGLTFPSTPTMIASLPVGATTMVVIEAKLDNSATGPVPGSIIMAVSAPGSCTESIEITYNLQLNTNSGALLQAAGNCVAPPDAGSGGGGDDGGGCCDAGPLRSAHAGLALGILALLLRRRRRH